MIQSLNHSIISSAHSLRNPIFFSTECKDFSKECVIQASQIRRKQDFWDCQSPDAGNNGIALLFAVMS